MDHSHHIFAFSAPQTFLISIPYGILVSVSLLFGGTYADREDETSRQNPVALGYYNLIITEYSYKFWAAFMVATIIILIYSCLAAIWLAHTMYLPPPISYDEYDYLARRSIPDEDHIDPSADWWPSAEPPSPRTSRRIFRAITSPPLPT